MIRAMAALVRRDLRLAIRGGGDSATAVLFFVLAAVLFPFGIGPETAILQRVGPGVVWVTALLAGLLGLERLFLADYEDGSLDQLALAPLPLELVVLAKAATHWITTGLPLILVAPVIAVLFGLPVAGLGGLVVAMLAGTPTLSLIGAVGAALVLGARRGGVLLALLVLPLAVPILIFGVAATDAMLAPGRSPNGAGAPLMILLALLALALPLAPWAAAAALRQAVE